jgi:hypothetical protein
MDKKATERLLLNYSNARKSWEGWCYLNNIDLKNENSAIRKTADENELLFHCRYLLLKDLHIELYKIIRKKDRTSPDNIFKLLKECNSESAQSLLVELNNFQDKLDSLTGTRDKFYAHLDDDYLDYIKSFKIDDYYKTFEFIESAIIILGKKTELYDALKLIPSRDEFTLSF